MRTESLNLLQNLIATASPSGYEQDIAKIYRSYIEPFVDDVTTDVMGNVKGVINPRGRIRVMLAAHMDEIGFMVHHIDADGFLHFSSIGGNDSAVADGQRVWVHGNRRTAGVIGGKAMHLQSLQEQTQKPKLNQLWIDIGARSRAEAESTYRLAMP